MRTLAAALASALLLALVTAPPALAESKNHGSSDAPWLIGLLVVVLLGLGMMMLRLRSGMRRRDPSDHFRQE
jgi:hypothetical protein